MFFFIAGIQPKTVYPDSQLKTCPSCGATQARPFRVDHYFSAFFIPLFRVKKGTPFLKCGGCGRISDERAKIIWPQGQMNYQTCSACGSVVDPSYRFCPHCGKPL